MSKPRSRDDWNARLVTAEREVWKAIDSMADELREQVVLPLCRQHRLTFSSGNGTWWFTRIDARRKALARRGAAEMNARHYSESQHWSFHEQDEALLHGLNLGDVWALLALEPIHAVPLGYCVADITETDIESGGSNVQS